MKDIILLAVLMVLILLPLATAAEEEKDVPEWENQHIDGVNKEAPHATLMPYRKLVEALKGKRLKSPYCRLLNGDWKFHWSPDPGSRPMDFYKPDYDSSQWKTIPVPSNWQIEGYGTPNYLCAGMVFPVDPPKVMSTPPKDWTTYNERNAVGNYITSFEVPKDWNGRRLFINFDGVDSAFYIWINGRKVGFSVNSRCPAEFDITDYVHQGKNLLAVEVYRFSAATYLENQDMWFLSGIFRNVTLWSAPSVHIRDFFIRPDLDEEYRDGKLSISASVKNLSGIISDKEILQVQLYDRAGEPVENAVAQASIPSLQPGEVKTVDFGISVANPLKWTAETPNLYTVVFSLKEGGKIRELISSKTGFRKIEIKGNVFMVNGTPVKLKGANRHENWPDTGHYVTEERMVKDLELLKGCNCNHVRTSHYSNDPRWYELCDEYGIYLIAEANVECHGSWSTHGDKSISHDPSWKDAFVDRVTAEVERDKNYPSVVIWSLGNESGDGENLRAALAALLRIDTSRPTHYEGFGYGETNPCDIDSQMYTFPEKVEEIAQENRKKPFYLCEYAHAMNNSMGALGDYNDLFDKYPCLMGGAIWEWQDQAIWNKRDPKHPFLAYGGDFGDVPNNDTFILKGVVFADRKLTPKYPEVKRVYQWVAFEAQDIAKGEIRITNKYSFTNLSKFQGEWRLEENGAEIGSGKFTADAAPGDSAVIKIPFGELEPKPGTEYLLHVGFTLKEDELWAKAGTEIAASQFQVSKSSPLEVSYDILPELRAVEKGKYLEIEGKTFSVSFDRSTGTIARLVYNGTSVLAKTGGPEFHPFRAPHVKDDLWAYDEWVASGLDKLGDLPADSIHWAQPADGIVMVHAFTPALAGKPSGFDRSVTYTVCGDGSIGIGHSIKAVGEKIAVPRIADRMIFNKSLNRFAFYGRGPMENYPDRKRGSDIGRYSSTVRQQMTPYVKTMECGNHEDVRWATLTDANGNGVVLISDSRPLAVSALPYTDEQLLAADHPHQLSASPGSVVCIGTRTLGVGSKACGPGPMEKYITYSEDTSYSYIIRPVVANDLDEKLKNLPEGSSALPSGEHDCRRLP